MQYNISKKINLLITKGIIDENVALFGIDDETQFIVSTLKNAGIKPKALIRLPHNKLSMRTDTYAGIRIYNVDAYYKKFGRENKLLVGKNDWFFWQWWLIDRGFYNGHRAIVGLEIQNTVEPKRKWFVIKMLKQMNYQDSLVKKYGKDMCFFCYKYNGLGDAYVIYSMLIQLYRAKFVLIVTNPNIAKVSALFDMNNVEIVLNEEMDDLYKLIRIEKEMGISNNFHLFTPNPFTPFDILHCVYGPNLTMKNIYEVYLNKALDSINLLAPNVISNESINRFFIENAINRRNAVILSTSSNSVVTYDYSFWNELVDRLNNKGYKIIHNRAGNDFTLDGTYDFCVDLKYMPYFVEKTGRFIGVRSGLCDVISGAKAKKIILYPKQEILNFSESFLEAFSFDRMSVDGDFCEISWPYGDYDELVERILDEIGD